LRDENVLESALARAKNRWQHEPALHVANLAAAYGWSLTTGHSYRDGNKRVGFVTMATFAALNGCELDAPEEEVVQVMLAVADRRCTEQELADWVRAHLIRTRPRRSR